MTTCEKCGAQMEEHWDPPSFSVVCPECGWGWATTKLEPIDEDQTVYNISLNACSKAGADAIKAVAKACSVNFLAAKKMIENPAEPVFSGKAREAAAIRDVLDQGAVRYEIDPPFPY